MGTRTTPSGWGVPILPSAAFTGTWISNTDERRPGAVETAAGDGREPGGSGLTWSQEVQTGTAGIDGAAPAMEPGTAGGLAKPMPVAKSVTVEPTGGGVSFVVDSAIGVQRISIGVAGLELRQRGERTRHQAGRRGREGHQDRVGDRPIHRKLDDGEGRELAARQQLRRRRGNRGHDAGAGLENRRRDAVEGDLDAVQ